MKRTNYIIKGIVGIVAIALFISCNKETAGNETATSNNDNTTLVGRLPVAYINTDSLLNNYQFVIDKNDAMLKKAEDKRLSLGKRQEKLQKEIMDHYQKAQMNAYYSRERQQQEETRLQRQQQDLEKSAQQAEQELGMDQMNMQLQLQDTIEIAIKEFNNGKYQMIFANTAIASTFFYVDESYDITQEVIEFLNARYVP